MWCLIWTILFLSDGGEFIEAGSRADMSGGAVDERMQVFIFGEMVG